MTSRVQLEPAYVLHSRSYRETSLIVEAFTREHGRLAMVARGARAPRSRWRHILQPFRPLLIGWSQKSDLGTLTAADQVAAPPALEGPALYCGFYLNEILMRLLQRGDPHPEVFGHYQKVLLEMASGSALQPLLRVFERHLLEAIGYAMLLEREADSGEAVEAGCWYVYQPDRGPLRCTPDNPGRISGGALLALAAGRVETEHLAELRMLLRNVIGHHLDGRPLRSPLLFGD